MFSALIFSLTINLSSGIYPDSLKAGSTALADTSYAENIRIADSVFIWVGCDKANKYYEAALSIRPGDVYANQKMNDCSLYYNREKDSVEINFIYQKILNKADEYFLENEFLKARDLYIRARIIRPSELFIQDRITICDQKLETEYNNYILKGDVALDKKDWLVAKKYYSDALLIKDDPYPRERIMLIDQKFKDESAYNVEEQYQKILAKADEYFQANDYAKAKAYYERALSVKPTDAFVREQIKLCDEKLKN